MGFEPGYRGFLEAAGLALEPFQRKIARAAIESLPPSGKASLETRSRRTLDGPRRPARSLRNPAGVLLPREP
jgi:hypothetical protein